MNTSPVYMEIPSISLEDINKYPKIITRRKILEVVFNHFGDRTTEAIRLSYMKLLSSHQLIEKMQLPLDKIFNKKTFYYPQTHYICEHLGIDPEKLKI